MLPAQIHEPGHKGVVEIASHSQQCGCATGFAQQCYLTNSRTMLSGRPLLLDNKSDLLPAVFLSGLQNMKKKLLPFGAEPRYVGKIGGMQ